MNVLLRILIVFLNKTIDFFTLYDLQLIYLEFMLKQYSVS